MPSNGTINYFILDERCGRKNVERVASLTAAPLNLRTVRIGQSAADTFCGLII